jgi:hypothetical protein
MVATYLQNLCNGMRAFAETDVCKAFRLLERRARSRQDQFELERLYLNLASLTDGDDHQGLYERVLQGARKRGCTLTPGPKPGAQTLIRSDAEPFTLDTEAPFDLRAAEIVFVLAAAEMAHLPIDWSDGPTTAEVIRLAESLSWPAGTKVTLSLRRRREADPRHPHLHRIQR